MKFTQAMILLAAIGVSVPLQGRAEHMVASKAYIYPGDSTQTSQLDIDYDSHGNIIHSTYTYPNMPEANFTLDSKYTYLSGDLWTKSESTGKYNSDIPDYHVTTEREYDAQNRLTSYRTYHSDSILNVYYIDYTDFGQGLLVKTEEYVVDQETWAVRELTSTMTTVFSKALGRYLMERESKRNIYKVTDDSIVEKRFDESGALTFHRVDYYYNTTNTGYRYWDSSYNRWYGDMTEISVDSVADLRTEIIKTVDQTTGAWIYVAKTETTLRHDVPMNNGYLYRYIWNQQTNSWKRNETYTYTWENRMLRKCESVTATGSASESYSRFSPEGEYEGPVRFVSDDLYYLTTQDIDANCTYYTYYNKAGSQRRKIKADHHYHFIDKFEELSYGEWVVPTQTFTLYQSGLNYVYTIDSTGFPFVISERSAQSGEEYYATSYSRGGFPIKWSRMYTGIGGYEDAGEGVIKQVNDDVLSSRHRYSKGGNFIYSEYDTKRGVILNFTEEANAYVYSSYNVIERNRRSYSVGDTAVSVNTTFDYGANLATMTRRESYKSDLQTYEAYYEYNWDKATWVFMKETCSERKPRPDWETYKVADVLDFTIVTNPSHEKRDMTYITFSTANDILAGGSTMNYDTYQTRKELDPLTGEMKTEKINYVEYESTPEAIARKNYVVTDNGLEYVTETRYELDANGYISRYVDRYYNSDGDESIYGDLRYYYNKDQLLVQLERISQSDFDRWTMRWAYDEKADLINNFTSVSMPVSESYEPEYRVEGLSVFADEAVNMSLYSLDGRLMSTSGSGEVSAPSAGIYILRIGGKVVKVFLR